MKTQAYVRQNIHEPPKDRKIMPWMLVIEGKGRVPNRMFPCRSLPEAGRVVEAVAGQGNCIITLSKEAMRAARKNGTQAVWGFKGV